MKITKQRELKVLAEIAKKAEKKGRFNLDYIYFFNGNAAATDGRLLAILPDCWIPEENDPEKVWIKIEPAKVNNKLNSIKFEGRQAIANIGIVLDIKNEIIYPPIEKIIPDFTDTHLELMPFGYMESGTTWIISKLDFIASSLLWYSVPRKKIAYLDTGDSPLIIIGYGTDLHDNLEISQSEIRDKSRKALSLFPLPVSESKPENIVNIPIKKEYFLPDDSDERIVFNLLYSYEHNFPIHIDSICKQLNWPVSRVSSALGLLELKNYCVRESGMRFRKAE